MDDHNVHQLWGLSPYIDLLAAARAAGVAGDEVGDGAAPLRVLQVCPYDCRHTLATLAAAACEPDSTTTAVPRIDLVVFEESPELLARHMLLLYCLLDGSVPPQERAHMFLELHGNALLRRRTADWLEAASRVLEAVVVAANGAQLTPQTAAPIAASRSDAAAARDSGEGAPSSCQGTAAGKAATVPAGCSNVCTDSDAARLGALFDLSLMRFEQRDLLAEAFKRYRQKSGYDIRRAWELRARRWYGPRYDVRRNMVDWDYHMRIAPRGTPGLDPALGSIIAFPHFRHWRETGVAYEPRGGVCEVPNTSLLTVARGRTKEFKDRSGRDVGRSVEAFGFWGDTLNSPYHAFGTAAPLAPNAGLFKTSNKAFVHSARDVAQHNIGAVLCMLRTGQRYDAAEKQAASSDEDQPGQETEETDEAEGERSDGEAGRGDGTPAVEPAESAAAAEAQRDAQQGDEGIAGGAAESAATAAAAAEHQEEAQSSEQGSEPTACSAAESVTAAQYQQEAQKQSEAEAQAALQAEEAALDKAAWQLVLATVRLRFATGDLRRSLAAAVSRRPGSSAVGAFAAATLGHMHVHFAGAGHGLAAALAPGAPLLVETAANLVQLNAEQAAAFEARVAGLAEGGGFERLGAEHAAAAAAAEGGGSTGTQAGAAVLALVRSCLEVSA